MDPVSLLTIGVSALGGLAASSAMKPPATPDIAAPTPPQAPVAAPETDRQPSMLSAAASTPSASNIGGKTLLGQ